MEVTIGGQRLGSGNKQNVHLRNYERSTHDLSYIWRSTMASGTLVPFMTEIALPGDTFDIDLQCDILTHPTIGPLFGTYKIQLDVFQIPMRLYQGKLHMNMLGIGMDMSNIKLPQILVSAPDIDTNTKLDNQQINPSSILSYLGIRGLGHRQTPDPDNPITRAFNALPFLGYWDIYKQYYANKQEEIGAVIHKPLTTDPTTLTSCQFIKTEPEMTIPTTFQVVPTYKQTILKTESLVKLTTDNLSSQFNDDSLYFQIKNADTTESIVRGSDIFNTCAIDEINNVVFLSNPKTHYIGILISFAYTLYLPTELDQTNPDDAPQIATFPLENIDRMRQAILSSVASTNAFEINGEWEAPYGYPLAYKKDSNGKTYFGNLQNQEGLALKTYQSDLFNNWISTEWIDGTDGISNITAIDTSDGSFTLDELNLSKKIYDMLNRIALSGGTYDDWLDAVYTHDRTRSIENPMYIGGLIQNLVFQEVISNSATESQPLGTLAGRGRNGNKNKGGKIIAKIDEPSYIMGIISITPNIDYSQGNKWDVNLQTMNDLHKPALDEIGFQDLITDQMAYWDTYISNPYNKTFKSAGKQPAWINYMTNINVVKGNFADQNQQMFMVLNRRYESPTTAGTAPTITDLTTYIDPSKFNHIFADTRRDAQNFWAQIGINIQARRKMSAKVIPNL